MKKIIRLITALGMISLMMSFAGCNLQTEAELGRLNTPQDGATPGTSTPGNTTTPGTVTSPSTGTTDTIGDAWGALFSDHTHNPIDLQVWQGFDATYDSDYGMKCNLYPGAWFGGAIVQKFDAPADGAVYYDMSAVTKMTFKVKASNTMTIWAGYSNQNQNDSLKKQNVNVTKDWQTVTISQKGVAKAWAIFAFGSDGVSKDEWLAFKDVTFFNASGESVSLKYAN